MRYMFMAGSDFVDSGPNPGFNADGLKQIAGLKVPPGITTLVVGTGRWSAEVVEHLQRNYPDIDVIYSPLLGTSEARSDDGVIFADGRTIPTGKYTGIGELSTNGLVDMWKFVHSLPQNSLVVGSPELNNAFGLPAPGQDNRGRIFRLNQDQRTAEPMSA